MTHKTLRHNGRETAPEGQRPVFAADLAPDPVCAEKALQGQA